MALSDDLVQIQRMKHVYQMEQRSQELVQQRQQQIGQQQEIEQQAPALVQNMEVDAQIEQAPPQAQEVQNRRPSKKQRERQREDERALRQKEQADTMEAGLLEQRRSVSESLTMTPEQIENEKAMKKARENAISSREKADLLQDGLTETDKRRIKYMAQQERAALAGEYARMLPIGTKLRRNAMAEKEKEELKANELKKAYKVMQLPPVERAREEATISRHAKYDMLKKILRRDNPLSHEDAAWTNPANGHILINVGRAHMGGTKPMYIFEDREAPVIREGQIVGYKQYLFKEAVNCIGQYKPEGALVTEAAASLQDALCGPYSIPAFAAEITKDGKTRVLGSFQEKIDLMDEANRVDLFAWQADPQDNLEPQIKNEILREHTLDWLLCNFDTKGENFLHRPDGHLSSFDKEASFGKIKDPGAEHMSTDYKPHANDTLYNTIFTMYANNQIDLNLNANLPQIQIIQNMADEQYIALFNKMLDHKYGAASAENTARQDVVDRILRRKRGLAAEYQRFYGLLTARRNQAIAAANGQQPDAAGENGQQPGQAGANSQEAAPA